MMYDLRNKHNKKYNKYFNFLNYFKKIYLLYFLLLLILLFPQQSGEIIGNWIYDFFITIINIVKNGK